jgi:hypothetical protein
VKRPDRFGDMPMDDRAKGSHAVRRFLVGATGSPKTSSKESPFLPVR